MRRSTPEDELRDLARLLVRAGLGSPEEVRQELADAIERLVPRRDSDRLAAAWLEEARCDALAEQESWSRRTDYDLLEEAFATCEQQGVRVLQGVADHWSAKAELERSPGGRGIVWFTAPDVWHAIDHGMLEINLWHADTANAAPGDELLDEVVAIFARHGLDAHFDEGRIEVAAHWRRRL